MSDPRNEEGVLRSNPALAEDLAEYEKAVRTAVSSGQLLTAIEVARDGLRRLPDATALKQQLALALAQTGALEAAQTVLTQLMKESPKDEETLSLVGRVHKELWRRASKPAEAAHALERACHYYGEAFALKGGYYPGINLAFMLLASGRRDEARQTAAKVEKRCREELAKKPDTADGWLLGTLAEALVHLGRIDDAETHYKKAAEAFKGRWRDLASMQRQAREITTLLQEPAAEEKSGKFGLAALQRRAREVLLREKRPDQDWLDRCFDFPSVVIFAGHMIDAPGRKSERFPPREEGRVKAEIRRHLDSLQAGVGFSSAACGGDILFSEALLERGARVNLVLPGPVDAFKRQSVEFAGADWVRRFHDVLGQANSVLFANASEAAPSDVDPATSQALLYANRIVLGLAVLQARALDLELRAIAVWDGRPGDANGGTASNIAEWSRRGIKPIVISPKADAAPATPAAPAAAAPAVPAPEAIRQEIRTVVEAEILNFRRIVEAQMPAFIREFKGRIGALLQDKSKAPSAADSWGGYLRFVFEGLEDAALFVVSLREMVSKTNWSEHGLPPDLGVRIAVHAGPVFVFDDPAERRANFVGAHSLRTTRIIPVTPPGQIYASQEFAALCGAEGITVVGFEFLGRVPTTKLFDDAPLYRVDRLDEVE